MIEIYTKPKCKFCNILKEYLTERNISFIEYHIGIDVTRDFIIEKFPTARKVPIAVVDGSWIGDHINLMEYVKSMENEDETVHVSVQKN